MNTYDVVIIGGGHAGVEAANILAQSNINVGMISLEGVPLASAPCNPAIGGVGKGHVVREIDAMGGLMGKAADYAAIQCRLLNTSKGFAVRSTRFQIDKQKYSEFVTRNISKALGSNLIYGAVVNINHVVEKTDYFVISYREKARELKKIRANKVIITAGTFLGGEIHTGDQVAPGGRYEDSSSSDLRALLKGLKLKNNRFKTGTPPRIYKESIDFSKMEVQDSDRSVQNFHWKNYPYSRNLEQLPCFITHTNNKTLEIIRENKDLSPIFNGQIKGVGPRYCPSIEDKAFRYPDKDVHHIFVEPEGLDLDTYYPNGVSTSLPFEIQKKFIRTIIGLENAEIAIPGHAVEYDVVDTEQLGLGLEVKALPGLYFAGQINGTSGYEEAAAQGLVAGIDALLKINQQKPFFFSRYDSYIGVMIDDLVHSSRDEPYRLFSARAENRLLIREDNTILRMAKYRKQLGLKENIDQYHLDFQGQVEKIKGLCSSSFYLGHRDASYFEERGYGALRVDGRLMLGELLKRSQLDPVKVLMAELGRFSPYFFLSAAIQFVAIDEKYSGHISRYQDFYKKVYRLDRQKVDWNILAKHESISFECRKRITDHQPQNFGQLKKIFGLRPSTLATVATLITA